MSKRRRKKKSSKNQPGDFESTPAARWPEYVVAAGLALIVFVRPWRDGASFQGFNAYFVWLTMALGALWASRLLFRDTEFRHAKLVAPLAAFVLIGLVTSYDSFLPDRTFRQLIYWTTSLFLFLLAANVLRTPRTRGIFLTAFAITMICSGAWALIHLEYVLPQVRQAIEQSPAARQYYFQAAELPPELAHRLSVNRAYGATLFPNALAAFMILALPFFIAEATAALFDWRSLGRGHERAGWKGALAAGAAVAVAFGVATRLVYPILYYSITTSPDWQSATALNALVLYSMPVALGLAVVLLLRATGYKRAWLYTQIVLLPAGIVVVAIALYQTYSRGGMLAFGIASAGVAALLLYRAKRLDALAPAAAIAAVFGATLLAAAAHAQDTALPLEGVETDVFSPASFLARLDYWRVGMAMAFDNPVTGVGLGAFGAAYANYMFPGAATSQMAHNHFVQVLAETGPIGLASILVFWTLFIAHGVRSVLNAPDAASSLRIAGPFGGVLAFLIHSCVDFNFANPSLAMTAFVFAGACVARAATVRSTKPLVHNAARPAAVVLLIAVVVVISGMIRIFSVDYALTGPMPLGRKLMLAGNRLEIRDKLYTAGFYLDKLATHAQNPQRVLYGDYDELLRIIPDHHRIVEFGFLAVLDTSDVSRFHRLIEGEVLPEDAVVVITDVEQARRALVESAGALLRDLERIDRRYPYIVEVSMHAFQWADLIFKHAPDPETKRRFAILGEQWAERSVQRSPYQSGAWMAYGQALWQRATTEPDNRVAQRYYDEGLTAYRRAAETFPVAPSMWESYAAALDKLGRGYVDGGNPEKGNRLLAEAEEVREHVRALQREWAAAR